MSEAPDYPLNRAIDHIRDTALEGYAELKAQRDQAIAERDKARAERDDLRANVAWLSGRL